MRYIAVSTILLASCSLIFEQVSREPQEVVDAGPAVDARIVDARPTFDAEQADALLLDAGIPDAPSGSGITICGEAFGSYVLDYQGVEPKSCDTICDVLGLACSFWVPPTAPCEGLGQSHILDCSVALTEILCACPT